MPKQFTRVCLLPSHNTSSLICDWLKYVNTMT